MNGHRGRRPRPSQPLGWRRYRAGPPRRRRAGRRGSRIAHSATSPRVSGAPDAPALRRRPRRVAELDLITATCRPGHRVLHAVRHGDSVREHRGRSCVPIGDERSAVSVQQAGVRRGDALALVDGRSPSARPRDRLAATPGCPLRSRRDSCATKPCSRSRRRASASRWSRALAARIACTVSQSTFPLSGPLRQSLMRKVARGRSRKMRSSQPTTAPSVSLECRLGARSGSAGTRSIRRRC